MLCLVIKVKMKEKTESKSRKDSYVRVDLCTKTPGGKSNN